MAQKSKHLMVLLAFSLAFNTPASFAKRAYSSFDSHTKSDGEVEVEEASPSQKAGYQTDWSFLKTIETTPAEKDSVLKAAEGGDAAAMVKLASMYFHGKGVDRDFAEALKWNKTAAFKGNAVAQNNLGHMYEEGMGTKKDPAEAFKWYKLSSGFGNPNALCNIGVLYETGKGTAINPEEALASYKKAADQGNSVARRNAVLFEFALEAAAKAGAVKPAVKPAVVAGKPAAVAGKPVVSKVAETVKAPVKQEVAAAPAPEVKSADDGQPKAGSETLTNLLRKMSQKYDDAGRPLNSSAEARPITAVSPATSKSELDRIAKQEQDQHAAIEKAEKEAIAKAGAKAKADREAIAKAEKDAIDTAAAKAKADREVVAKAKADREAAIAKAEAEAKAKAEREAAIAKAEAEAKAKSERETLAKAASDAKAKADREAAIAKAESEAKAKAEHDAVIARAAAEAKARAERDAAAIADQESKAKAAREAALAKAEAETKARAAERQLAMDKAAESEAKAKAERLAKVEGDAKQKSDAVARAKAEADKLAAAKVAAAKPVSEAPKTSSRANEVVVSGTPMRPIRDKWALVVGISKFNNKNIPELKYSSKDASDFYNYLVKDGNFQPDHVRLLIDEKASQRRIMSELGTKFLARVVKPDDLVVLYFSTHGSPSQMDIRGKNYLVAADSDPDDLYATGIEMQKIVESIQGRVLTDRVLLVLDACHSGFAGDSAKGVGRAANFDAAELAQGSGQMVLCSSDQAEQSWESTRYENGVFTRNLLKGLQAKGTKTTLVDAYSATKKMVSEEVREDRAGSRQTPVLKGKWNGNDLIVAVPPAAAQSVPMSVIRELEPDSSANAAKIAYSNPTSKSLNDFGSSSSSSSSGFDNELKLTSSYFKPDGDAHDLVRESSAALKSTQRNPSELYYMRAQAYIQLKEWMNAMTDLSAAIQNSPNKGLYYLARGYVYSKLGRAVLAQEDIEQARFYDQRLAPKITFGE